MSEEEADFEALQGAVAGVRQWVAHLRKTQAPPELLQEVERDVAALNERLRPYNTKAPIPRDAS
jgi:hypothetical protein